MPFTLSLTHRPPALHAQTRHRTLASIATAAAPDVQTLWLGLFHDVRQCVDRAALTEALQAGHLFDVHALLDQAWWQCGDRPGRALLQALALDTVEETGATMEPPMRTLLGAPITFVTGLPETEQAVARYVGEQLRLISTTTLTTVRRMAYAGWQAEADPAVLAGEIIAGVGLTPTQARSRAAMRERLQADGQAPQTVAHTLRLATDQALRTRAQTIAATETWTLVHLGQRLLAQQAERQGVQAATQLRRFWQLGPNPCAICIEIPGMNPDGVDLQAGFQSPLGIVYDPGLHPHCRCSTTYRVVATA